jgi:hypothetical protein
MWRGSCEVTTRNFALSVLPQEIAERVTNSRAPQTHYVRLGKAWIGIPKHFLYPRERTPWSLPAPAAPGTARLWLVLDRCRRLGEESASWMPWGDGLWKGGWEMRVGPLEPRADRVDRQVQDATPALPHSLAAPSWW